MTLRRSGLTSALIAAALLAIGLAGPAQAQWTPQSYFSPNGGGADATAEVIDNAQDTLDVAMYSMSTSGPIWNSLKAAIQRGVRVRVVMHKGHTSNKHKTAALEGIGAHVFAVTKTMHQKFALADAGKWWRRKLVNGSANWSTGAETRYSENTVVYGRHYHLFYAFQQEFNRLLADAKPLTPQAAANQEPVRLNKPSSRVRRYERAVFTSANFDTGTEVVADEIIALMQKAEESIVIDVAHFNSQRITDALIAVKQAKPSLQIEVMVDLGEYADGKSKVKQLEGAGIEVRYKTYSLSFLHPRSQLQHHKTMIVDRRDMITGSYNWSETAELRNYENVIVVQGHVARNKPMIEAFLAEHDRLWNQNRDRYAPFMAAMRSDPSDADYRRYVPIHFDTDYYRGPMSLTRSELRDLRSAAWAAGAFERQPNGKRNVEFSYLDRENRDVYRGNPPGTFIDLGNLNGATTVLSGLNNN
ncbi:MAG TPA: hypothetical protein DEA08_35565 [Planctomycetes bacterium]|nr:hypothetical protein [Planctomycetota bacterium]